MGFGIVVKSRLNEGAVRHYRTFSITGLARVCHSTISDYRGNSGQRTTCFSEVLLFLALFSGGSRRLGCFGKIAWTVVEFQSLIAKFRINYLDLDAPVRAVASLIRRGICNQVLLAQIALNLCEGISKLSFIAGK